MGIPHTSLLKRGDQVEAGPQLSLKGKEKIPPFKISIYPFSKIHGKWIHLTISVYMTPPLAEPK